MFLCRRLLRVHIPKRVPPLSRVRQFILSNKAVLPPSFNNNNDNHTDPPPIAHFVSEVDGANDELPTERLLDGLVRGYTRAPMQNEADSGSTEGWLGKGKFSSLDAYTALRKRDRAALATLPPDTFTRIATEAHAAKSVAVMDDLAADLLEISAGTAKERTKLARMLLSMSTDRFLLQPDRAISLLSLIDALDSLLHIPPKVVARIVRSVAAALSSSNLDKSLLDTLISLLNQFLRNAPVPAGAESVAHNPPGIVLAAHTLVRQILKLGQEKTVLDVFQVLIDTGNIPPEALNAANSVSKDFNLIVRSTLVRSCLHWSWRSEATSLLLDIFSSSEQPDKSTIDLAVDVMYTLLETPTEDDITNCCSLICRIDTRAENFTLPHGLIRLFYDSARHLRKGDQAERLYAYTQSDRVLVKHYPPPQGGSLPWLMRHITRNSRDMHLGRILANQVVRSNEPIPLHDRARFIAITAANGYGTHARALWERYSVGRDRNMVVGNASTMVRMVSLFGNLISKEDGRIRNMPSPVTEEDDGSPSELDEAVVKDLGREHRERRLQDFTSFAERILTEFRRSKQPLSQASHQELNALARAHFILGQVTAGFDAFKIFMDRKEVPDLYDVNVALSAVAEYHPRNAAQMIERMVEKGLEPDAVTFGTIIHHAIVHRDMALVDTLIQRARDFDHGQLTLKSVSALIRASVTVEAESRAELRANLDRALNVIQSLTNSSFVCTPNTGKYCIFAALRVDDPVMAFRFWRMLVKDKTEWGDREQVFQRRLIARRIGEHCKAGWLRCERGAMMLSQLGEGRWKP